jgi:hypothetical protein
MKTSYPPPAISGWLQCIAVLCFLAAGVCLIGSVASENGNLLVLSISFLIVGMWHTALAKAVHLALDSLYRSAVANEQMLALMPAGNPAAGATAALPASSSNQGTVLPPAAPAARAAPPQAIGIRPPATTSATPHRPALPPPGNPASPAVKQPSPASAAPPPAEMKALCIYCSQSVTFPSGMTGQEVPCPSCAKPLLLSET